MQQKQLTKEEEKDRAERVAEFRKIHEEARERLQVDVGFMPQYVPTPEGFFGTVVVSDYIDLKYRHPSPLDHVPTA